MKEIMIERIKKASKAVIITDGVMLFVFGTITLMHLVNLAQILTQGRVLERIEEFSQELSKSISSLFIVAILTVTFILFCIVRKERTPFLKQVSTCIKVIGGLVMFISPIPRWIGELIILFMVERMEVIIFNDKDIICILIGGIFACLGLVFDYGCILQKQEDETL